MKDIIVFDMDGTLSLNGDRVKYLLQKPKDWDSYFEACDEDAENPPITMLCRNMVNQNMNVKIVTGRRESTRLKTHTWLHNAGIFIKSNDIYMRKDGDKRHDIELKPELVKPFINDILIIFEDRNSVVKKWRELGITCLQVAEGDF